MQKINSRLIALGIALGLGLGVPARADVLKLRQSCAGETGTCFTDLGLLLQELHVPTPPRQLPGLTNQVLVDIGPGTFTLTTTTYPYCQNLSNISFKGAGKIATTLTGGGFSQLLSSVYSWQFPPFTVAIESCSNVEFQDLTILQSGTTAKSGVLFEGSGGTQWTNVRISVNSNSGVAWADDNNGVAQANSTHYWFDDEFDVTDSGVGSGFETEGASHRIYG